MMSIDDIRSLVLSFGKRIGAPMLELSVRTGPSANGDSYVEIRGDCYSYVREERGVEFERRKTEDLDLLVYWLMSDVIFRVAVKYELERRMEGRYSRKLIFEKELELMRLLSEKWWQWKKQEIESTLLISPYSEESTSDSESKSIGNIFAGVFKKNRQ